VIPPTASRAEAKNNIVMVTTTFVDDDGDDDGESEGDMTFSNGTTVLDMMVI